MHCLIGLSDAQKSFLGLVQSAPVRVDIEFKDAEGKPQKTTTVKLKGTETEEQVLYSNHDDVIGEVRTMPRAALDPGERSRPPCAHATTCTRCACMQVKLTPLTVKKLEHQGIKVQLLGQIELATERGHPHEFVSLGERRAANNQLRCMLLLC